MTLIASNLALTATSVTSIASRTAPKRAHIKNSLVYTQLVHFESDEYHSAVAKTVKEAKKLIEAGFEYVCTHSDSMLFRKRK